VEFVSPALNLEEQLEVAELLSSSGPRTLPFARGVFTALATVSKPLDPTDWIPLLLGEQIPSQAVLKRILSLLMRDAKDIATSLARGEAPVPTSTDEDVIREYCRGYVQIAQKDRSLTTNQAAFDLILPILVLSGYAERESLRTVAPEAAADPVGYTKACVDGLSLAVTSAYEFLRAERAKEAPTQAGTRREKVGRNDSCPCGSGLKYKKCCQEVPGR
jgi:uncharacterized protein